MQRRLGTWGEEFKNEMSAIPSGPNPRYKPYSPLRQGSLRAQQARRSHNPAGEEWDEAALARGLCKAHARKHSHRAMAHAPKHRRHAPQVAR